MGIVVACMYQAYAYSFSNFEQNNRPSSHTLYT